MVGREQPPLWLAPSHPPKNTCPTRSSAYICPWFVPRIIFSLLKLIKYRFVCSALASTPLAVLLFDPFAAKYNISSLLSRLTRLRIFPSHSTKNTASGVLGKTISAKISDKPVLKTLADPPASQREPVRYKKWLSSASSETSTFLIYADFFYDIDQPKHLINEASWVFDHEIAHSGGVGGRYFEKNGNFGLSRDTKSNETFINRTQSCFVDQYDYYTIDWFNINVNSFFFSVYILTNYV